MQYYSRIQKLNRLLSASNEIDDALSFLDDFSIEMKFVCDVPLLKKYKINDKYVLTKQGCKFRVDMSDTNYSLIYNS